MSKTYMRKKAHREAELNRQRRIALYILSAVVLVVCFVNWGPLSAVTGRAAVDDSYIFVPVRQGDTLWSLAGEYTPEGRDIRDFISEIALINSTVRPFSRNKS